MKRKTVLVDLDNCVYPFAEIMAQVIASNTETTSTPQNLVDLYKSWDIHKDWGIPQGQFDWWWEKGVKEGIVWGTAHGVPPIPGATTALWELSDREWHIHLVTSRLNKFRLHDQAAKNTVEWLANWGVPYRSLSFTADKHQILGDAIIDDAPFNLVDHPAPIKILFPSPHNRRWIETPYAKQQEIHTPVFDPTYNTSPWTEVLEILGDGRA